MPYKIPGPVEGYCNPEVIPDPRVKYEAWMIRCTCGWVGVPSYTNYDNAVGVSLSHHPNVIAPGPGLPTAHDIRIAKSRKDAKWDAKIASAAEERAQLATCPTPNKERFRTKETANKRLRQFWKTGRGKKMPQRIYKCRCGRWHLTSQAWRGSSNVSSS